MKTGWLSPLGEISWHDLATASAPEAITWFWADQTGTHTGALPTEAPLATHLWGWGVDTWYRVRVDNGRIAGAKLTTAKPKLASARAVEYDETSGTARTEKHMIDSDALRGHTITIRQVCGPQILTFVSMKPS